MEQEPVSRRNGRSRNSTLILRNAMSEYGSLGTLLIVLKCHTSSNRHFYFYLLSFTCQPRVDSTRYLGFQRQFFTEYCISFASSVYQMLSSSSLPSVRVIHCQENLFRIGTLGSQDSIHTRVSSMFSLSNCHALAQISLLVFST